MQNNNCDLLSGSAFFQLAHEESFCWFESQSKQKPVRNVYPEVVNEHTQFIYLCSFQLNEFLGVCKGRSSFGESFNFLIIIFP